MFARKQYFLSFFTPLDIKLYNNNQYSNLKLSNGVNLFQHLLILLKLEIPSQTFEYSGTEKSNGNFERSEEITEYNNKEEMQKGLTPLDN